MNVNTLSEQPLAWPQEVFFSVFHSFVSGINMVDVSPLIVRMASFFTSH